MDHRAGRLFAWLLLGVLVVGCAKPPAEKPAATEAAAATAEEPAGLALLSPEDHELAAAQKLCPITNEPLGSMGAPYKVSLNGEDVFLCCAGCKGKAQADPEATLAKVRK